MTAGDIRKQGRGNAIAVTVLSVSGIITLAASFPGRQTELIEYCFKPNDDPQFCTPEKRYIMPTHEFEALRNEPASNPKSIIPQKATRLRIIPATNPYKWLWATLSTACFGAAYGLSKARELKLLEYLPQYRNEVKQSWLLDKINHINHARKIEYAANLDYQLWQFNADRAARAKQLSVLSPEEIAVFQEQARIQAEAEAKAIVAQATEQRALPHGNPGNLDDVNNPGDKLSGESDEDKTIKSYLLSEPLVAFDGAQGSGKSSKQAWLIGQHLSSGDFVIVATPFGDLTTAKGIKVYGRTGDFGEVAQGIFEFLDEAGRRKIKWAEKSQQGYKPLNDERHWHLALDEFTNYGDKLPKGEDESTSVLTLLLDLMTQELRQLNMSVSLSTHVSTQRGTGGSEAMKGLSAALKRQATWVRCFFKPTGERKNPRVCRGDCLIEMAGEKYTVSTADMRAPTDYDFSSIASEQSTNPTGNNTDWNEVVNRLDDEYKRSEFMINEQPSDDSQLSPEAQKVLDYCKRKIEKTKQEFVSVKEIQVSGCISGAKSEDIRAWLGELAEAGKGEYDPDNGFKPN
ncbi:MAG: hypothetical protein WA919_03595 [Coleofasciculaceae cyanobacterium]